MAWRNSGVSQPASLAFALLGLAMTWYADHGGGLTATDGSTVLIAVSVILEVASTRSAGVAEEAELGTLDAVIASMDGVALGVDIGQWTSGY
jgi:hypothetical protein